MNNLEKSRRKKEEELNELLKEALEEYEDEVILCGVKWNSVEIGKGILSFILDFNGDYFKFEMTIDENKLPRINYAYSNEVGEAMAEALDKYSHDFKSFFSNKYHATRLQILLGKHYESEEYSEYEKEC